MNPKNIKVKQQAIISKSGLDLLCASLAAPVHIGSRWRHLHLGRVTNLTCGLSSVGSYARKRQKAKLPPKVQNPQRNPSLSDSQSGPRPLVRHNVGIDSSQKEVGQRWASHRGGPTPLEPRGESVTLMYPHGREITTAPQPCQPTSHPAAIPKLLTAREKHTRRANRSDCVARLQEGNQRLHCAADGNVNPSLRWLLAY